MGDIKTRFAIDGEQEYRKAMSDAAAAVKVLNSEQKLAKAQFQNTGNAEKYAADQARILKEKLAQQKSAVKAAEQALKQLADNGVQKNSKQWQQWQTKLNTAQTAMVQMETELQNLQKDMGNVSSQAAAMGDSVSGSSQRMADSLSSINKKVSLDAVIGGIDKITKGLESAGRKAVEVGKQIWDNIMDSAAYADDTATLAMRMGLTTTEVQQMQYVANRFEAPVETVAKAWKKVKMSMSSDSDEIMEDFKRLGIAADQTIDTEFGKVQKTVMLYGDYKDVFWQTGEAIMKLRSEEERERVAQKLLGRSWDELIPLFTAGREAYEEALAAAPTNSEESINNAAALNDKVEELKQSFQVLKIEVLNSIAPALTKAAETLEKLITSITEYLQTPEGKQALEDMGKAVEGLFEDLGKIDPKKVVKGFTEVFDKIVGGLQWMVENKNTLTDILKVIVTGWGLAKLTGGALQVYRLIQGIRSLGGVDGVKDAIDKISNGSGEDQTTQQQTPKQPTKVPPGVQKSIPDAINTSSWALNGMNAAEAAQAASAMYASVPGLSGLAGAGGIGGAVGGIGNLSLIGVGGGTALIAAVMIALGEIVKGKNREWRGTVQDDAHRYDNLGTRDQQVIQTTIRGIMGGESPMSREWQMRWMAQNMGGRIWDAFNYTDAATGEQRNRLGVWLGGSNAESAEAFALIAQAYGLRKDRMGNYDMTSSAALQALMNSDPEINRLMTMGSSAYAMYQQTGNKVDYANLWSDMTSFFRGSMLQDENGQYWTPELYAEKQKADEEATKKITELGSSSDTTGGFVRVMGEESETATGHITELGERSGGAEDGVTDLGFAAAAAAAILASIKAPDWGGEGHANGLWAVPFDGYHAILHKGERVVPAREASSRNYNSNLYVESMYMNNGQDAEGLAAAMAAAQRRTQAGYGS